MKALVRKTPVDIAEELDEEVVEVGADFGDKITEKLKKYGYNTVDLELRRKIVKEFFERR